VIGYDDRLAKDTLSFGPFRLIVAQRRLEQSGVPLRLSARALDILVVLIEHAGEVVTKKELMVRVWADVTVDEGSLRVHVAGLRKALADGEEGPRYLVTLPGRGYCFVAPVSRSGAKTEPVGDSSRARVLHSQTDSAG
jgi:DNA-binding winged helix-turn-helix (wHTH) protein